LKMNFTLLTIKSWLKIAPTPT